MCLALCLAVCVVLPGAGVAQAASGYGRPRAQQGPAPAVKGKSGRPERVVSLVPALTETVIGLGEGGRLVGVSDSFDPPPELVGLAKVGTFLAPVVERVLALEPDLVLTSPTPGNENAVRTIGRAGVRVVVVQNEGSLAAVRRVIGQLAELFEVPGRGRTLLEAIDAGLQRASRIAATHTWHPRVAVVVGREPLVLAGPDSYLGELIPVCGGVNVAGGLGGRWPRVGIETLIALQPEVLVDLSMGSEDPGNRERLRDSWSRFPALPAVGADRLYLGAPNLFQRPGPRVGEAAVALADMLRP